MEKFIYICGWIFLVIVMVAFVAVMIAILNHAVASAIAVRRLWKSENNPTLRTFIKSIKYWFHLTWTGENWNVMINLDTNERVYWPGKEPKNEEEDDSDGDAE